MSQTMLAVSVAVGLTVATAACPDYVQPSAPGTVVVDGISLRIVGNLSPSSISETTQLMAMVRDRRGAEKAWPDVRWTSSDPTTVVIQSTGLATLVDFGTAQITAVVNNDGRTLSATTAIVAIPPGTFAVSGRVREPGGGSLANFPVVEVSSGRKRVTRADGTFTIAGLTDGVLRFAGEGYETLDRRARPGEFVDAPLQRVLRFTAPGSISSEVARNDASYLISPTLDCGPCRLIRIVSSSAGTVDLQLTSAVGRLILWANGEQHISPGTGGEVLVAVPVGIGETMVYVGSLAEIFGHVSFTLSVSAVR